MKQIQNQQTTKITFVFPDKVGQELKEQSNFNEFVVKATQKALLEKWQDKEVRRGITEADAGELISHLEVKKLLNRRIK